MCALRAHIKFSIFRNIFLEIEKAVVKSIYQICADLLAKE